MLLSGQDTEAEGLSSPGLSSPFLEAEAGRAEQNAPATSAAEWASPFAETPEGMREQSATDQLLAEAFESLRDASFDEAVALLAEETEAVVADRFTDEAAGHMSDRATFAQAHLSNVQFEAERYLSALQEGLQAFDVESLSADELDRKLDALAPTPGDLTPAGEEFIGGLIKKAKRAVSFVANAAKGVGKFAGKIAGAALGPVLNKLKGLIRPLLKRVLSFAIGRLPAPLQGPARTLAGRLNLEAEDYDAVSYEDHMSPANTSDLEGATRAFDGALAEAFVGGEGFAPEGEEEAGWGSTEAEADGTLERLAEARGALIDAFASADEERFQPAVEQFVPVLLGALKLGINLVGRPKVVNFLAGFLGKLIGKWVGPQLAKPLSSAIVDTGLRLISLEAEDENGSAAGEAAPVALASVVEDTVRRLAEQEEYIFENEDLTQLAVSEAFAQAAATHFPERYVRGDLRQAPSLGGVFVARRPRSLRAYSKYSRVPEIEITTQIADAIPTFGGTTLGSVLRARGLTLPIRARLHIYQAVAGTTAATIARTDRALGGPLGSAEQFHPLTPAAAGIILREPRLGTRVPSAFLRSSRRLGVGQRVFALQPVGAPVAAAGAGPGWRAASVRIAPSRTRLAVDRANEQVSLALILSEERSQRIAQSIRAGAGHGPLLQALVDAVAMAEGRGPRAPVDREDLIETEDLAPGAARMSRAERVALVRRLRPFILPALAQWTRQNADAFARAAASPEPGVTVRIRLRPVPGLGRGASGVPTPARRTDAASAPTVAIGVEPGFRRP